MNMLCWLKHDWEKWGPVKTFRMLSVFSGLHSINFFQYRTCKRCGATQEKAVG